MRGMMVISKKINRLILCNHGTKSPSISLCLMGQGSKVPVMSCPSKMLKL